MTPQVMYVNAVVVMTLLATCVKDVVQMIMSAKQMITTTVNIDAVEMTMLIMGGITLMTALDMMLIMDLTINSLD
jgi:actin-like ATPase involved in cell morphogenesis